MNVSDVIEYFILVITEPQSIILIFYHTVNIIPADGLEANAY